MTHDKTLLLAFYGDDFTGSTDALEFLSRAGVRTVLFIQPPSPEQLSKYQGLQAIGVAGKTRSMSPTDMKEVLQPAFQAMKELAPRHVHYKICSTFDSSPSIGSIGTAIDVGAEVFGGRFIPLLVAAPGLGRYCVFGNLFARMGIGSLGKIHRLDRHPSMRNHPVTPSDESDLRLHLAKQTEKNVGLVDILQVVLPAEELGEIVESHVDNGAEVVLFDALYPSQMPAIGRLIDSYANDSHPLFSVGSSGVEMALGGYWAGTEMLPDAPQWQNPSPVETLLVASGSCSPVSAAQIRYALSKGFKEVVLDIQKLIAEGDNYNYEDCIQIISGLLTNGSSVILHTGCEREKRPNSRRTIEVDTGLVFGNALGRIVREVAARTAVKRIVIAGGDTSSYAAREMGIESVEMIAPLSPGAPLCKANAPGSPIDGLEVNFKGGQVGKEDYFEMVASGKFI